MRNSWRASHRTQTGVIGVALIIAILVSLGLAAATGAGVWYLGRSGAYENWPFGTTEDQPETEDIEYRALETYACTDNVLTSAMNNYMWAVVNMTATGEIQSYGTRIGRSASGTRVTQARIYTWNTDTNSFKAIVGSGDLKPYMDLEYRHYGDGQPQPIAYYTFPEGIILYEGIVYAIGIASVSGSGDVWFNAPPPATSCPHVVGAYQYPVPAYHDGENYPHWITIAVVGTPEVTTLGYQILEDGSVDLQGWVQVAGNMEAGFYYSTNATALAAGEGTRVVWGHTGTATTRQGIHYTLPYVVLNTTHYFYAFGKIAGIEYTGNTLSFSINEEDIPASLTCDVESNDIEGIDFATSMMGTVNGTVYNVSICYGTTMTALEGCNSTLTVATETTGDGSWLTHVTADTTFDVGTNYYYRAMAVGNDSTVAYSPTKQFVPYDPDVPSWLNQMLAWLNANLPGLTGGAATPMTFAWWVAIAAFIAAWVFAALLRRAWVGVFVSGLTLLVLMVLGMIPAWLMVLIIIVAGYFIFKLIFRGAGATGE